MSLQLLTDYLTEALRRNISQLFFTAHRDVSYRDKQGRLTAIDPEGKPLTPGVLENLILHNALKTQEDRDKLLHFGEVETYLSMPGKMRVRVNAYIQRGSLAMTLTILTTADTGITRPLSDWPLDFSAITDAPFGGLCLISGHNKTGCTALAASLTDHFNRTRPCLILTLEDMISTLHQHRLGTVNQRELPGDVQACRELLNRLPNLGTDVCMVNSAHNEALFPQLAELALYGITVIAVFDKSTLNALRDAVLVGLPDHNKEDFLQKLHRINTLCVEMSSETVQSGSTWLGHD